MASRQAWSPKQDPYEQELLRDYVVSQFQALTRHHSPDAAILIRVAGDHFREPVELATAGRFEEANAAMASLCKLMDSEDDELSLAWKLAELPASALIAWRQGWCAKAIDYLGEALEAGRRLAEDHDHDYLTARRLHFATNTGRVLISTGDFRAAAELVDRLQAVVAGDRTQWPFEGAGSLAVPLHGLELLAVRNQLASLRQAMAPA